MLLDYQVITDKTKVCIVFYEYLLEHVDFLFQYFLESDDETIYVEKQSGEFCGIVTPGDLYRKFAFGYRPEAAIDKVLNRNCRYVSSLEKDLLECEISELQEFNELPIVIEKQLVGVVKRNRKRDEHELEVIRETLITKKNFEYSLLDILDICEKTNINCLLYENIDTMDVADIIGMSKDNITNAMLQGSMIVDEGMKDEFSTLSVSNSNGMIHLDEKAGQYYSVTNHHRVVPSAPEMGNRMVYVFGQCTAFGAYVFDKETVEEYMQSGLNDIDLNYKVVNCGVFGTVDYLANFFELDICSGDIIVIILPEFFHPEYMRKSKHYMGNLSKCYENVSNPSSHFYDCPAHCDGFINRLIAQKIVDDIRSLGRFSENNRSIIRKGKNYYIGRNIIDYYNAFFDDNKMNDNSCNNTGVIVMNCNPFTKGHRYLIEKAAQSSDKVVIFVVEEDSSSFSFSDRLEMTKKGTNDIENVSVFPSGKYLISKGTFHQYFDKDNVSFVEDMSYDVRIFCEVIAPRVGGVNVRYVGEEPFDKVTRQYNETMKCLLSEYGMKLVEIPRLAEDGDVISASRVRQLMHEGKESEIAKYCPKSTIEYLRTMKL